MKIEIKNPPRKFKVGSSQQIEISDCGSIYLNPDEQVTFITKTGKRHDFAAKSWGFYVTPSVNDRVKNEGFKTALVRNQFGKHYVMVVEVEKVKEFQDYLQAEQNTVVEWIDERSN